MAQPQGRAGIPAVTPHPAIRARVEALTPERRAWWEERAGIREHEGRQSREEAERGALEDLDRSEQIKRLSGFPLFGGRDGRLPG